MTTHIVAHVHKRTLPAGGQWIINTAGRYIHCKDSSGVFLLKYDGGGELELEGSMGHHAEIAFSKVIIENPSNDPLDLTINISDGKVDDNRSSFSSSDPIPVQLQSEALAPNANASRTRLTANAAAVQIVAENANRRHVQLQNTGASNVWLWVDNVQLFLLAPFEKHVFEGRDALKASAVGGDGFISVLEV